MPADAADERPTVLVMEDEALVAMLVEDTLAGAGHRAAWTPDGRPGPAAGRLAAAVVDLRLADGPDGRDAIRRLRAARPGLPVVVATGFHPEAPEADLRGLGGPTLRLRKPFDCGDLAAGVAAVLDGPAAAHPAQPCAAGVRTAWASSPERAKRPPASRRRGGAGSGATAATPTPGRSATRTPWPAVRRRATPGPQAPA